MNFLMIDGAGDPNTTPAYQEALEALFSLSYALKFTIRREPDQLDYSVMPLEGLWWSEDLSSFTDNDRSAWLWTMMIMQPPHVGPFSAEGQTWPHRPPHGIARHRGASGPPARAPHHPGQRFLHLATVIDVYSRRVIGGLSPLTRGPNWPKMPCVWRWPTVVGGSEA